MIKARIIKAKDSDKKIAELHLYGDVVAWQSAGMDDWGCISLRTIKDELKNLGGADAFDEILLRINSPGGDVDEGFAIYNYVRSHGKPVTTIADGSCHSIASVIFLAGDVRKIYNTTEPVIHMPWTFAMGNADEIEETIEVLRMKEELILDVYVNRTGADREELRELMSDDKPMKAQKFFDLGFATEIVESVKAYAMARKKSNPTTQNKMGKVSKIFQAAFDELKRVFNEEPEASENKVFKTTDGKDLEIATDEDGEIKEGQACTIDGAPAADGDYPLEDGRTVSVADGKVSAVKEAESTEEDSEAEKDAAAAMAKATKEIKAAKEKIKHLENQIRNHAATVTELETVKGENTQMKAEVAQITDMLKKMKVEPPKNTTRTGITGKDDPEKPKTVEESKAEIKAKIAEKNKKAEPVK